MAATCFNVSKGRWAEFGVRVNTNDPTNSALVVAAFNSTATFATIRDLTTLAAIEADANTAEVTNSGYSRIVLDDRSSITVTPDNTNDLNALGFPDQTFRAIVAGTAWTHLFLGYDRDTTGGADSDIVPMGWYDFAVTPNGGDITARLDPSGALTAA